MDGLLFIINESLKVKHCPNERFNFTESVKPLFVVT